MTVSNPISTTNSAQVVKQPLPLPDFELSDKEREELTKENPQLLAKMDQAEPFARLSLVVQWRRNKACPEAASQAEIIQGEVAKLTPKVEQVTIAHWCGFPTDLTRCSPFFPLARQEIGERRYLSRYLITSANWGKIEYSGPQLSTYEEDALLALLAILNGPSQEREISYALPRTLPDGKEVSEVFTPKEYFALHETAIAENMEKGKTYTYRGPVLPLLRLLGYSKPNKKDYTRLIIAYEFLKAANVKLTISGGKTKTGRQRSARFVHMVDMISAIFWDEEKKEISVTINPFFYETYIKGRITPMDVARRMALKGSISKALFRFVTSQGGNPAFAGHFLTLADALNMDRGQPAYITRHQQKMAINELIRHKVLTKKSGFVEQDIIRLTRAAVGATNKKP